MSVSPIREEDPVRSPQIGVNVAGSNRKSCRNASYASQIAHTSDQDCLFIWPLGVDSAPSPLSWTELSESVEVLVGVLYKEYEGQE